VKRIRECCFNLCLQFTISVTINVILSENYTMKRRHPSIHAASMISRHPSIHAAYRYNPLLILSITYSGLLSSTTKRPSFFLRTSFSLDDSPGMLYTSSTLA